MTIALVVLGIVSLLSGVALYAGLGYSAGLGAWAADIPLDAIIATAAGSLHREIWLAIPLFILTGYLMMEGTSMRPFRHGGRRFCRLGAGRIGLGDDCHLRPLRRLFGFHRERGRGSGLHHDPDDGGARI